MIMQLELIAPTIIAASLLAMIPSADAYPRLHRRDGSVQPCITTVTGQCLSTWNCFLNDQDLGQITVDSGHTDGNAVSVCNQLQSSCAGNCSAEVATSMKLSYSDVIGDICTINNGYAPNKCTCPATAVAVSGRCEKGDNCRYFTWRCSELQDPLRNIFNVSTTLVDGGTTTDGATPAMCPFNTVATYIDCYGQNCDKMGLKCATASVQLADQYIPIEFTDGSGPCSWTPFFTNGGDPNTGTCPQGTFIRGLTAKGDHSSDLSFWCCSASYKIPQLAVTTTSIPQSSVTTSLIAESPASTDLIYSADSLTIGTDLPVWDSPLSPVSNVNFIRCTKKSECPELMCCSKNGYCGTTSDYCNDEQLL